jgi:ceramide glucosyltransferase
VHRRRTQRFSPPQARTEAVSVLEPLCGAEPRLFEKLATFCEQAHRQYQLLFGVSSPNDPAIAVVRRPRATYPTRDIELVVDPLVHGRNLKVSNLINLATYEKYPIPEVRSSPMIARRRAGPQLPESTHFGPSRLREL